MMLLLFRMFTDSCKRLRIMKSSEAIGLGETDSYNYVLSFISCLNIENLISHDITQLHNDTKWCTYIYIYWILKCTYLLMFDSCSTKSHGKMQKSQLAICYWYRKDGVLTITFKYIIEEFKGKCRAQAGDSLAWICKILHIGLKYLRPYVCCRHFLGLLLILTSLQSLHCELRKIEAVSLSKFCNSSIWSLILLSILKFKSCMKSKIKEVFW